MLKIRNAQIKDSHSVWRWRNNLESRSNFKDSKVILKKDHDNWYKKMQKSNLIILQTSKEKRIGNILKEYITIPLLNDMSNKELYSRMSEALKSIRKRLGGVRYKIIKDIMENAFNREDQDRHKDWIEKILKYYYDPMYIYKMKKREQYVVFKGSKAEIKRYLLNLGVS